MINVALISHSLNLAGAERMLFNCADILKNTEEYNPIVFMPDEIGKIWEKLCEDANIEIRTIYRAPWYTHIDEENWAYFCRETLIAKEKIKDILVKNEVDIVICNTLTSLANVIAAFELQIPVFTWVHGIFDPFLLRGNYNANLRLLFDRTVLTLSDSALYCSKWTQRFYDNVTADVNSKVLYNWTKTISDTGDFPAGRNLFICLNSMEYNKGIFTLLEAVKLVSETTRNFEVHFYGGGIESVRREAKTFVKDNALEDIIHIGNHIENVDDIYEQCLCLIQPSYIESFGMTLIEAASHKRPVIAARSGGPQEIVEDGISGFLVNKKDVLGLAQKMQYILDHKSEALIMGENGYKIYLEKFSPLQAEKELRNCLGTIADMLGEDKAKKKLVYDLCMEVLKSGNLETKGKSYTVCECKKQLNKPIDSNILVLSKIIEHFISYYVLCNVDTLVRIGVIFTSFQDMKTAASVELKISYNGFELRNCFINANDIVNNEWTNFCFDPIHNSKNKVFKLTFLFHHNGSDKRFGIYEVGAKRTLGYRVCNRLNLTSRAKDVLYVDLREDS